MKRAFSTFNLGILMLAFPKPKVTLVSWISYQTLPSLKSFWFFCLLAISLNAQNTAATWTGVVRTVAGEPVAGARVTVSSTVSSNQEKQQTAVTGTNGQFAIVGLASGTRTVIVQRTGEKRGTA
ncbi:MAG: carboxypeptidase-like regulatory domain-containing protein [Terriglobales bacterium]